MRRTPRYLAIVATIATMAIGFSLQGSAVAAPGDPVPDPNIKPAPGDPPTLSQWYQPTWQTNGIVWALEHVDGVIYAGGNFSKVRPPGAKPGEQEQTRKNLAAFDAKTGALLPFNHNFTAQTFSYDPNTQRPDTSCTVNRTAFTYTCDTVYEIRKAPSGDKIYVGGDFTKVDGQTRTKLAAFSTANAKTANNALDTGFKPAGTDRRVRSLAVSNDNVYAGGIFAATGGQARTKLAAFNRNTGALLPWAPKVEGPGGNGGIVAMIMSPDQSRVILAGEFTSINGRGIKGLDAVSANTGASVSWEWRGIRGNTFATDLTTDGTSIFVSAESRTFGEFEGRAQLDPTNGRARWVDMCKGATWSVAVVKGVLYSGSHAHNCSTTAGGFPELATGANPKWQRLLAQTINGSSTRILRWFPNCNGGDYSLPADQTPSRLGPRTMTTDGESLWVGGQSTVHNGRQQQSLVRFTMEPGVGAPTQQQALAAAPLAETKADPKAQDDPADLPAVDGGTFPGGPPPNGKPQPGVDNLPAPAKRR